MPHTLTYVDFGEGPGIDSLGMHSISLWIEATCSAHLRQC